MEEYIHENKTRCECEKKKLINRLNRIEGQIGGLKRMVLEDAYCPEIINQGSAAASALDSFNRELLETHIRTCVTEDLKEGNEETVEELLKLLKKMTR